MSFLLGYFTIGILYTAFTLPLLLEMNKSHDLNLSMTRLIVTPIFIWPMMVAVDLYFWFIGFFG